MTTNKSFYITFCSVLVGALTVFASEFPDDWTWDDKPEYRAEHAALEGKPMPRLSVTDWINGGVTAASVKGKVIVLDFYATWCGPCMRAIPHNNAMLKKYADKGLVIIAINLDKNKADMDDFLKSHPATFVILRDASNKLVSQVKIPTMPSSFLLDRDGKVHAFHRGFKGDETRKQYTEEIEALLK